MGIIIRRQISQTFNAECECWDHPHLENWCCGEVPWSHLGAPIDTPCYFSLFLGKSEIKGSILSQNNMWCLWEPLNGTMEFHHNINFPKRDGPNIQILPWKSVIFEVVLNFLAIILMVLIKMVISAFKFKSRKKQKTIICNLFLF